MRQKTGAAASLGNAPVPVYAGAGITVGLCFLVAVLEGIDIQAIGVAAPRLGPELGLARDALGRALAASNIGLVLGASLGGWLADKFGRKPVLIGSAIAFGVFTLATMWAGGYETLFAMRLGCGLGFGAALPNLMAMAAEVSPIEKRGSTATMMFCGMPAGGGTVALIAYLTPNQNWRTLFLIGGLAPLVIAPLLMIFMRETYAGRKDKGSRLPLWIWAAIVPVYLISYVVIGYVSTFPAGASLAGMSPWLAILPAVIFFYLTAHRVALFAEGRGVASVLLWIIFLPTLLILYLILNWLPTLVAEKGFKAEASLASVWFNFASVAGALAFGALIDRFGVRWPVATAYAGLIGTLIALSQSGTLFFTLALCAAAGFFLIGANYGLYGAAASYYPEAMRGRGSGASIAWGRLGSVGGPLVGGSLLASGASADSVVYAMAPFAIMAGVAVIILSVAAKPAR